MNPEMIVALAALPGVLASVWLAWASAMIIGRVGGLPRRTESTRLGRLGVVVPACDEEAAIEATLRSLATASYPDLRVIAVDDRSEDATGAIIRRTAASESRIVPVRIDVLPDGWLGKLNAKRWDLLRGVYYRREVLARRQRFGTKH